MAHVDCAVFEIACDVVEILRHSVLHLDQSRLVRQPRQPERNSLPAS
jgi:hypothetical protein